MAEEKSLKKTKLVGKVRKVVGGLAAIGGAALAGYVMKKTDTKGMSKLSKIFVPVGVFGLSHAVGEIARAGAEKNVNDTIDAFETFVDTSELVDAMAIDDEFVEDVEILDDIVDTVDGE